MPVLLWATWALVIRRESNYLVPFVAFLAGFLPWLAAYDRQMYFFYATALSPMTIVMLSLILGTLWKSGRILAIERLQKFAPGVSSGQAWVITYLAFVIAMFLYFAPILYGMQITDSYYESLMWFPSWK